MTRNEAIEINLRTVRAEALIVRSQLSSSELAQLASVGIDRWVALGMLKLDEPKSAKDVLKDCVVSVDKYLSESHTGILDKYGVDAILQTIEGAGFKIVEK